MFLTAGDGGAGLVRHDVVPLLSAYLLLMGMLLAHRRARKARGTAPVVIRGWPPTWAGLVRFLVSTALGGYGAFIALVLLYYLAIGGEDVRFIRDALTGGVWLGFGIAIPGLLVFAWIDERRSTRRARRRQSPD